MAPDVLKNLPVPWLPDLTRAKFYRNLALALAVPGALSYAISRALSNKLAAKEAEQFEKDVRSLVQAENPVMSLDPSLTDTEQEQALDALGVPKVAEGDERVFTPEETAAREAAVQKALGPWTGRLEPGLLFSLAYLASIAAWNAGRRSGAKSRLETEKARTADLQNALEKSEYDRLYQMNDPAGFADQVSHKAYIEAAFIDVMSGYGGKGLGDVLWRTVQHQAESGIPGGYPRYFLRQGAMLTNLVPGFKGTGGENPTVEFSWPSLIYPGDEWFDMPAKMRQASEWNKYDLLKSNKVPAPVDFPESGTERLLRGGARLVGLGSKGVVAGTDLANKASQWVAEHGKETAEKGAEALSWVYPTVFFALLTGSFAIGKNLADRTDRFRKREKNLRKVLTNETLSQQSPTILDATSDLPWERAKHLPADQVTNPDVALPEDVQLKQMRAKKEVRI